MYRLCKSAPVLLGLFFVLTLSNVSFAEDGHIQMVAPGTGWVLEGEKLHWTGDNGGHWTDITPPMPQSGERIADVFFRDTVQGWVLLSTLLGADNEPRFELASTTNSGANWVVKAVEITGLNWRQDLLAGGGMVYFLDSRHGWLNLAKESGPNFRAALMVATEDGGITWTRRSSPAIGTVRFFSLNDGWIAGGPGGEFLYKTGDGGNTWQQVSLQLGNDACPAYAAPVLAGKRMFVAVTYELDDESTLVLFASDDGGRTWITLRTLTGIQGYGCGVNWPSAIVGSLWVVVGHSEHELTLTQFPLDGSSRESTAHATVSDRWPVPTEISFSTTGTGWIWDRGLLATTDGGSNWVPVSPAGSKIKLQSSVTTPVSTALALNSTVSSAAPAGGGGSPTHTSIHMGFDTCAAPTASKMQTWWSNSPFYDTSVYIGGVNRGCSQTNLNSTWVNNTTKQGWGLIPIWAGLQAPCTSFQNVFSSNATTAASQAVQEADSAAITASALGLTGSIIYYDLENYDASTCGAAASAFVNSWVSELHLQGYQAGVYGNTLDAGDWWANQNVPDAVWLARYDSRATTWALAHDLSSSHAITDAMWTNHQRAHQFYAGSNNKGVSQTWGSVAITIDIDIEDIPVAGGSGAKSYGTWTFTTVDYPVKQGQQALALNDAGADNIASIGDQIVGFGGDFGGYFYINGSFLLVTCPSFQMAGPFGINNLGQLATFAFDLGGQGPWSGEVYAAGNCAAVNYPSAIQTYVQGINDAQQVVGLYSDSSGVDHGFFLNYGGGGSFIQFDYPGASDTSLLGINGQGQVLGSYRDASGNDHGFIWNYGSDGSLITLDSSGAASTEVESINSNGYVVGWTPGNKPSQFLYSDGSFKVFPLDPLSGVRNGSCACETPLGINNYNRVVGSFDESGFSYVQGFWAFPGP